MKMNKKDANRLKEILKENGFDELAQEIDKAMLDSELHYRELMSILHGKHEWKKITKKDVKKMQGSFSEKDTRGTAFKTVFENCSHCLKCGVLYKYLYQKDFAELTNKQKTDAGIFVKVGPERFY